MQVAKCFLNGYSSLKEEGFLWHFLFGFAVVLLSFFSLFQILGDTISANKYVHAEVHSFSHGTCAIERDRGHIMRSLIHF